MSLWNDIAGPVFDGVELAGVKNWGNDFFVLSCSIPFYLLQLFPFYSFFSEDWYSGGGVFELI